MGVEPIEGGFLLLLDEDVTKGPDPGLQPVTGAVPLSIMVLVLYANHIGRKLRAASLIADGRTTRHPGYAASLRIRKRIEEGFGWVKEVAGLAQVKLRGLARVDCAFVLGLAAYNRVRLPKLLAGASP